MIDRALHCGTHPICFEPLPAHLWGAPNRMPIDLSLLQYHGAHFFRPAPSCCSQRGSAKMQAPTFDFANFYSQNNSATARSRRLWHCAAHRFLSLFKRQNYTSAKLILNKILMQRRRRLHANGSIRDASKQRVWKPPAAAACQARSRLALPRAPCTPRASSVCALACVIQFNFLGMTRFTICAHLLQFSLGARNKRSGCIIWRVMRCVYVNIIPSLLSRERRHVRVVISLIHLSLVYLQCSLSVLMKAQL